MKYLFLVYLFINSLLVLSQDKTVKTIDNVFEIVLKTIEEEDVALIEPIEMNAEDALLMLKILLPENNKLDTINKEEFEVFYNNYYKSQIDKRFNKIFHYNKENNIILDKSNTKYELYKYTPNYPYWIIKKQDLHPIKDSLADLLIINSDVRYRCNLINLQGAWYINDINQDVEIKEDMVYFVEPDYSNAKTKEDSIKADKIAEITTEMKNLKQIIKAKQYFTECKYNKSIEILDKVKLNFPEKEETYFYLGLNYLLLEDFKKAKKYFLIAKAKNPDYEIQGVKLEEFIKFTEELK